MNKNNLLTVLSFAIIIVVAVVFVSCNNATTNNNEQETLLKKELSKPYMIIQVKSHDTTCFDINRVGLVCGKSYLSTRDAPLSPILNEGDLFKREGEWVLMEGLRVRDIKPNTFSTIDAYVLVGEIYSHEHYVEIMF